MKKKLILVTLILIRLLSGFSQPIKVSENGLHLLNMDGSPFFWLGDTGWELFHRLDRDEVKIYFENRSEKGFNVIQAVWWSTISGTCGHTYGCNPVWQMFKKENPVHRLTELNEKEWYEALDATGAFQMEHHKNLVLSRFSVYREPNLTILSGNPHDPAGRLAACSSPHTIMVYNPTGKSVAIDPYEMKKLFPAAKAWWYNPRNGKAIFIGEVKASSMELEFSPEGETERGNDWLLILDDASIEFGIPGKI